MSDFGEGLNERVGANVQRLRTTAGMSQADLANSLEALGISMRQQTIATIERGVRPLKLDETMAMAKVFRVDLDLLVGDVSEYVEDALVDEMASAIYTANYEARESITGLGRARARAIGAAVSTAEKNGVSLAAVLESWSRIRSALALDLPQVGPLLTRGYDEELPRYAEGEALAAAREYLDGDSAT